MGAKYEYWIWNEVFSMSEIKVLVDQIANNYDDVEPENMGATDLQGNSKKNLNCKQISYYKIKDKLDFVLDRAYAVNGHHFGFNLYPKNDHDVLNYNVYNENQKANYDWHVDESREASHDIKLTVLINLSTDSYEGGTFKMFHNNEFTVPDYDKPGSMIMFRSHINHQVSPVTRGERKSLAAFLRGPRFI